MRQIILEEHWSTSSPLRATSPVPFPHSSPLELLTFLVNGRNKSPSATNSNTSCRMMMAVLQSILSSRGVSMWATDWSIICETASLDELCDIIEWEGEVFSNEGYTMVPVCVAPSSIGSRSTVDSSLWSTALLVSQPSFSHIVLLISKWPELAVSSARPEDFDLLLQLATLHALYVCIQDFV